MAETAAASKPPLDDMMMAMDVVDTLRHNQALVERELSSEQRRERMIERLRGIYESQGITVSDRILAEGVDALEQERFVYKPKRGGFAFTLARLYVRRGIVARNIGIGIAVVVLGFAAWFFLIEQPRQNRIVAEQERLANLEIELNETIPAELVRLSEAIAAEANDPDVAVDAAIVAEDGLEAARLGEIAAAREAVAQLETTLSELRLTYEIRIVSRPGEQSGVFRIPNDFPDARNYYLIVEALGPDGQPIPRTIVSEEDEATRTVTIWGIRVPESVYNAVRADKQNDGIVQNDLVGEKIRGDLEVTWIMDTLDGAILEW